MQIYTLYLNLAFENSRKVHHGLQGVNLQHGRVFTVVYLQSVERNAPLAEADGYLVNFHTRAERFLQ